MGRYDAIEGINKQCDALNRCTKPVQQRLLIHTVWRCSRRHQVRESSELGFPDWKRTTVEIEKMECIRSDASCGAGSCWRSSCPLSARRFLDSWLGPRCRCFRGRQRQAFIFFFSHAVTTETIRLRPLPGSYT